MHGDGAGDGLSTSKAHCSFYTRLKVHTGVRKSSRPLPSLEAEFNMRVYVSSIRPQMFMLQKSPDSDHEP